MRRCMVNAESHCKLYPRCYGCNAFRNPTNADRIRSMSDEELADFLEGINACSNCAKRWNSCFPHWDALEWLQQPAKEDSNG